MLAACPFPANHGTPGSIREMSEAMVELGQEVHIVTYHFGENIPIRGPILHRIPALTGETAVVVGPTSRRPFYDLLLVFKTLQVIDRIRPHVLHAHGYEAQIAAWMCQRLSGVPVLYSGHQIMQDELASYGAIRPAWLANAIARFLDAFVPRTANRCLPHTTALARFFHGMGLAKRSEPVIGFGIDLAEPVQIDRQELRRTHGLGAGPIGVYSGVMDRFQRLDLLLAAVPAITAQVPDFQLLIIQTIANERHLAELKSLIAGFGIGKQVVVTEPQSFDSVKRLLALADVAVVSRPHASGLPIKLINYMAAKRPCVLFASSTTQGLIHGENVYLAPEDTADSMAQAIVEVLRNSELRRRLAEGGFRFVQDHHDRRRTAAEVCHCYLRTIAAAGQRLR
jgi:glycosyltransferase involved in cell wall biosynthesis